MVTAPVESLESYRIQDRVYRLVQADPDMEERLSEMIQVETAPHNEYWQGWRCQEVHTDPHVVNRLIYAHLVNEVYHSRGQGGVYRLASVADTRDALASLAQAPARETVDVDGLFRLVVGHEKLLTLLRHAIRAEKAVHCLIISPPGMAKTLILGDIGALAGAEFYVGSTTSKSGLVGMLLTSRPRYLVIDEIDKMASHDMSPLLNLMETGCVTRLIHGSNERITLETKVFAGCNDPGKIDPAITSRFAKFTIPPYTADQFIDVATTVLAEREGQEREMAKLIASWVVPFSTDIRDAVRVARMVGTKDADPERDKGRVRRLRQIVDCLFPHLSSAPLPIRPGRA